MCEWLANAFPIFALLPSLPYYEFVARHPANQTLAAAKFRGTAIHVLPGVQKANDQERIAAPLEQNMTNEYALRLIHQWVYDNDAYPSSA